MFITKKKYKEDMSSLQYSIECLRGRLSMLECKHSDTKFEYLGGDHYFEKCISCGATLAGYATRKEMLEKQLENKTTEMEAIRNKIKFY